MFHLDSKVMDAIFDEEGALCSYIIKIGEIIIEIPVFSIEAEKRTASVLWIWLSKISSEILTVF